MSNKLGCFCSSCRNRLPFLRPPAALQRRCHCPRHARSPGASAAERECAARGSGHRKRILKRKPRLKFFKLKVFFDSLFYVCLPTTTRRQLCRAHPARSTGSVAAHVQDRIRSRSPSAGRTQSKQKLSSPNSMCRRCQGTGFCCCLPLGNCHLSPPFYIFFSFLHFFFALPLLFYTLSFRHRSSLTHLKITVDTFREHRSFTTFATLLAPQEGPELPLESFQGLQNYHRRRRYLCALQRRWRR